MHLDTFWTVDQHTSQICVFTLPTMDDPKARFVSAGNGDRIGTVMNEKTEQELSGQSDLDDECNYTHLERQRNPYLGKSLKKCLNEIDILVDKHGMEDLREDLHRGVRLACDPSALDAINPDENERYWIGRERSLYWKDKWAHPKKLYFTACK